MSSGPQSSQWVQPFSGGGVLEALIATLLMPTFWTHGMPCILEVGSVGHEVESGYAGPNSDSAR